MAQNLQFSSFYVVSGWSVQHVPIIQNCLYPTSVANPKSSGILSKAYWIPFPRDFRNTAAQPSSCTTSWWEIVYFPCKTCPEVLKEKRTSCFHSNPTFLLVFHKLKPRGHKYQMVFFTKDEKVCCSCTQKSWRARLKLGHFHLISEIKIYGTTHDKATRSDHARQKLNDADSGCNSQSHS